MTLGRIGILLLGSSRLSSNSATDSLPEVGGAEDVDISDRAEKFKTDRKDDEPLGPGNSASPTPKLGSNLRFFLGRAGTILEGSYIGTINKNMPERQKTHILQKFK